MVTASPGATIRSGPGDATVDDVKPQPAGVFIRPNSVKEAGLALAWKRPGMKAIPKIPVVIRRDVTTVGLKSLRVFDMDNLL